MILFWLSIISLATSSTTEELKKFLIDDLGLWSQNETSGDSLVETPTNETVESLSPIIGREYSKLADWDFGYAEFAPNLIHMNESTPFGNLKLGERIVQKHNKLVFEISGYQAIIKYMHDCIDGPFAVTPHPLAKEVWLQNEAARNNITIPAVFLSPPIPFPISRISRKFDFALSEEQYANCHFAGGTIRYAIMNIPAGESIRRVVLPPVGSFNLIKLKFAMSLGGNLILTLKELHSRGIVHGNLVLNNIRVHYAKDRTISVSLHDFASASTVIGRPLLPIYRQHPIHQSPWEITVPRYGFRDDVFRACLIVAQLINPPEYLHKQFAMSPADLMQWKMSKNIFIAPNATHNHIRSLNLTDEAQIMHRLSRILFYASLPDIQYDFLIHTFFELCRLAADYEKGTRT